MAHTAYEVGNPNLIPVHAATPHFAYHTPSARCTTHTTATNMDTQRIDFVVDPAGDTVFLPYGQGEIHSIRLPSTGAGPVCFITAGMSGCKAFIDTIAGSTDLIVYHANCIGVGNGLMNVESPALTLALAGQRAAARAYWTVAPHNLVLAAANEFGRAVYGNAAVNEENRKRAQDRANVMYIGGTTVIGELVGGYWHFCWQTYGSCMYRRPFIAPKGLFGNRDVRFRDVRHRVLENGVVFTS